NISTNTKSVSGTTAASPDVKAPTFAGLYTATGGPSPAIAGHPALPVETDQTISLNWNAATDDYTSQSAVLYDIYMSSTKGGQAYGAPSFTTPAGATNYQITDLTPGTKYYFVVRARDEVGNQDTNTVEIDGSTDLDKVSPTFAAGNVTATPNADPTKMDI